MAKKSDNKKSSPLMSKNGLAYNLFQKMQDWYRGGPLIMREDVAPQDMSFQDAKLERLNKMMKNHPLRNRDWEPEHKTLALVQDSDVELDTTLSRQVRRQVERMDAKAKRTHFDAHSKEPMSSNERVVKEVHPETEMVTYSINYINRPTLTLVNTGRYIERPKAKKKAA